MMRLHNVETFLSNLPKEPIHLKCVINLIFECFTTNFLDALQDLVNNKKRPLHLDDFTFINPFHLSPALMDSS